MPSKVAQKNSNPLFSPCCPELPNWPKQKNSCSKLWPIDQQYIDLGKMGLMNIPKSKRVAHINYSGPVELGVELGVPKEPLVSPIFGRD